MRGRRHLRARSPPSGCTITADVRLRLDIGNGVQVNVDLLPFDIRQAFPSCHLDLQAVPRLSLRLDVGSEIGGFAPR